METDDDDDEGFALAVITRLEFSFRADGGGLKLLYSEALVEVFNKSFLPILFPGIKLG